MTAKELAEKKVASLVLAGYKKVQIVEYTPCEVGNVMHSIMMFDKRRISPDAEVMEKKPVLDDNFKSVPGVMIGLRFVKPRCRKETNDYIYAALA